MVGALSVCFEGDCETSQMTLRILNRCVTARSPGGVINDWFVTKRAVPCLVGSVICHPLILGSRDAYTSELYYLDLVRGVARAQPRWYRLERPDGFNLQRQ